MIEISISNVGENGSIEQFFKNYNQIQYIITKYGTINEPNVNDYESVKGKRFSNAKLVRILKQDGRINNELMNKLMQLISFRNSFIHGGDLTLSQEDVDNSAEVLTELQQQLNVR